MTNQNHNAKAVRATMGETLLMTAMVCFAPFTLCAMMLLSSAI